MVKLVDALRAVTATAFGVVTVPSDCTVRKIRLFAVTDVFDTTASPSTSVAVPCLALLPSLTRNPFPAALTRTFPVEALTSPVNTGDPDTAIVPARSGNVSTRLADRPWTLKVDVNPVVPSVHAGPAPSVYFAVLAISVHQKFLGGHVDLKITREVHKHPCLRIGLMALSEECRPRQAYADAGWHCNRLAEVNRTASSGALTTAHTTAAASPCARCSF